MKKATSRAKLKIVQLSSDSSLLLIHIEGTLNVHNATRKAVICKFSPTFIKWQVVNQMFSINIYTLNQNWDFHLEKNKTYVRETETETE